MTWIWLISLAVIVPIIYLLITKKRKEKYEEPNFIHIFPDYSRDNPYEIKPGETIGFIVKGYKDSTCVEKIKLKASEIEWQHQDYIGKIIYRGADNIEYKIPEDKNKRGKILYIAVSYHNKRDATWMRIAK